MRRLLLLAGLGVWYGGASAQQPATEATAPFRKANVVRLYSAAPADSILTALARQLGQRGYQVVELDAKHLLTAPGIEAGGQGWPLVIRAERAPGGVWLTGRYQMPELPGHPEHPAEFMGFYWSPAKLSFRQVEKTATAFPRGQVRYARQ